MPGLGQVKSGRETVEKEIVLEIKQRNGDPYLCRDGETPATITVVGADSARVEKVRARHRAQNLKLSYRGVQRSQQEVDRDVTEELIAAVTRWAGWWEDGSAEDLPCTPENLKRLFEIDPDIRDQVAKGVYQHAVFFEPSSSTSSHTPATPEG